LLERAGYEEEQPEEELSVSLRVAGA
jgi:hypothetical protein